MTESAPPPAPPRTRQRGRRGAFQWLASEWGLALLALVLAVLIWAVVWGKIGHETGQIKVDLDLRAPEPFVAYYGGDVWIQLYGPRGEIDRARRALGSPPMLVVRLPGLEKDAEDGFVQVTRDMVSFPFPARLVKAAQLPLAELYQWKDHRVTYLPPTLVGVAPGFSPVLTLEPAKGVVAGPAGKISSEIKPDDVDVSSFFSGVEEGFLPPDRDIRLSFADWRAASGDSLYRAIVELDTVTAHVRFAPTDTRKIRNRITFRVPDGYVVEPDTKLPDVSVGYFAWEFEGLSEDLDLLKASKDDWWFYVRIPPEDLPAEAEESPMTLEVMLVRTSALDRLRVRLVSRPTLFVTVKREAPPDNGG